MNNELENRWGAIAAIDTTGIINDKIEELLMRSDYLDDITCDVNKDDSLSDIVDYISERINEHEVIYYSNAMDILCEEDPSLTESLGLAAEFGFDTSSLNSELLATLFIQGKMREELYNIENDISEALDYVEVMVHCIEEIDGLMDEGRFEEAEELIENFEEEYSEHI